MKIFNNKNILTTFLLTVISVVELLAKGKGFPEPRGAGGFDEGSVVGGPIDDFIPLLIVAAITFGVWALNRRKEDILSPIKVRD